MGNVEYNTTHIMGIPERKESKPRIRNLFEEIMTENFPNLVKERDAQVQEVQSTKQDEPKRPIPRHIIIKISRLKTKREFLKQQEKDS